MPEFTYDDRLMIMSEAEMWAARQILLEAEGNSGVWNERIKAARVVVQKIAEELRNYNDQFEESPDVAQK